MAERTGIAQLTLIVKHICRLLAKFRPAINTVIAAAVSGGHITAEQSVTVNVWLDAASGACDILRMISGY
jgi:hypothetical protein